MLIHHAQVVAQLHLGSELVASCLQRLEVPHTPAQVFLLRIFINISNKLSRP